MRKKITEKSKTSSEIVNFANHKLLFDSTIILDTTLSILIPTFNSDCTELVNSLHQEAMATTGLRYEIVVAEDGSTDPALISLNHSIATLPDVRHIIREKNVGRSAIRNFLAREAQYPHLLFIDSHMSVIRPDFLRTYLSHIDEPLVYGGYIIPSDVVVPEGNLRYLYEQSCAEILSHANRQQSPYANFHTSNFMISRDLMLTYPLDERFKRYGYEDVLWGKTLQEAGVGIHHISNPLGFSRFEDNARYMEKTDEGLQTLHEFRDELQGYSRLLGVARKLRVLKMPLRWFHALFGSMMRKQLTGPHPSLWIFKVYRLTYYFSLT